MSLNVDTSFMTLFPRQVKHAFQQTQAKLRSCVDDMPVNGAQTLTVQNMDTAWMNSKSRDGDVTPINPSQSTTSVTPVDFYSPILVDRMDQLKTSVALQTELAKTTAMAAHRKIDQLITTAWDASAPTITTTAGGFTLEKVLEAVETLREQDADEDTLWGVLSPAAHTQAILDIPEFKSADYVQNNQATNMPKMFRWLGVNWLVHAHLPVAAGVRSCFVGTKVATLMGVGQEIQTRVDWVPLKQSYLICTTLSMGVTVRDTLGIMEIPVTE